MRLRISVLVITTLIISLWSAYTWLLVSGEQIDCLYMLSLLDKTIDLALKRDNTSLLYATMLLRASNIPLDLQEYHKETYETIIKYIEITMTSLESQDTIQKAHEVQLKLRNIRDYVARLEACSVNKEAANALRINIGLKLSDVDADVGRIVAFRSQSSINMFQLREEYAPGEELELEAPRDLGIESVEIYAWPSLIKISEYTYMDQNNTHVKFHVRIPTAWEVESAGVKLISRYELMILLYARLLNNTYVLVGFTKAAYTRPNVWISTPSIVRKGNPLSINIVSDREYNVTIWFNKQNVINTTVNKGSNEIGLEYISTNYTIGYNDIKVCIEPGIETISMCVERQVVIEPNYPRVRVTPQPAFISWFGTMQLVISNEDVVDVYVVIESSWDIRRIALPPGATVYTEIFVGPFPVYLINNKITIYSADISYDTLIQNSPTLVINIPSILVFMVVSSLIIPVVSSRERGFIFLITTTWRGFERTVERVKVDKQAILLKPYEMGLGSSIALMLYGLIKRLKIRQPALHETLREHYLDASRHFSRKLKEAYWKMLLLAERDLYSSKKPSLSEAEELYYGVLNATTED